jgi:alcohol dehydrogenase class IV
MVHTRPDADRVSGTDGVTALRGPREILFGAGQRNAISWVVPRLGRRAFICVDPFFEHDPQFTALLGLLDDQGVAVRVHSGVIPELPIASVIAAADAAREHRADVFVAVGGGSCIDLAKVAACLLAHGGAPSDYYGEFRVPGPILPLVAIPTTAGTGSEVTPVAVLTDPARETKVGISSPHLIPTIAICDPELTISCPPGVTASSGADALAHCIEAYTAIARTPSPELAGTRVFIGRSRLTDEHALRGIAGIVNGLRRAYTDPEDIAARSEAMYGSLMGGLAFGTAGTAAAHALQYPIGAVTRTPHGLGVGILLPYVMEYNRPVRETELAVVARLFGATDEDDAVAARRAPELVQAFLADVGIPADLGAIGFPGDRVEWALERGRAAVRLSENNPRPLDDGLAILRAASVGDLALVAAPEVSAR